MAAAVLVTLGALWSIDPVAATHTATFESTIPADASNHTYEKLTVRTVASGRLSNAAVTTDFFIERSGNLSIQDSDVGAGLWIYGLRNSTYADSTVGQVLYVNASDDLRFSNLSLNGTVVVIDSDGVHFENSTFRGCVENRNSNITFSGPAPCVTHGDPATEPTPTSHPDCYENGQFVPCSTDPTSHPDCYENGQFVPCPTETKPAPTQTTVPYDNYVYELVGQELGHDVYVRGADRVVIRESSILGDVFVGSSANVFLEDVEVSGSLTIDRTNGVTAAGLRVGRDLGLSEVNSFKIVGGTTGELGTIGGFLGCFRCANGLFSDLRVGGLVEIVESTQVERVNVVGQSAVDFTPAPKPAPGALRLNVTDESLEFTHQAEFRESDVAVSLDYELLQARAHLQLSPGAGPDEPQLDLESRFEKIVEFEDRNGDHGYDLSDLVLREYLIEDLKPSISQERLGAGQDGWRGRIDYALPSGGSFSLIFTATDANPDDTKIDVAFNDYPYANADSQLALQVRLASASDWDIVQEESEDRLLFHGNGVDGYFGWLHHVEADGANASVVARVLEEHRSQSGAREVVLYLAYPQAQSLLHDPSIGILESVALVIPELGNLLVYGSTLLAVLVVLWALGQPGRRREH